MILTPVDDCREKGEESEVRWVLPEADVESQDLPDTMSGLAVKMSDLDRLSDRLRQKLDVFEGAAPSLSEQYGSSLNSAPFKNYCLIICPFKIMVCSLDCFQSKLPTVQFR